MKDVAQALGFSVSTVSLALAGRSTVAKATRDIVIEKAKAMGYRKNPMVAALMETRRRGRPAAQGTVIAFLDFNANMDELRKATHPDFYPGCAAEAERMGLRLERFFVRDPAMPPRRLCAILRARGIRGVILGASSLPDYKLDFDWDSFCWTSMTISSNAPDLDLVSSDHYGDTCEALLQAKRFGYRRAALMVRRVANDTVRRAWLGAYLAHAGDINADGPLEPFQENSFDSALFSEWLKRVNPDVIITSAPVATMRAIRDLVPGIPHTLGLISVSVPRGDQSITGFFENWPALEIEAVRHVVGQVMRNELGVPAVPRRHRLPGMWNPGSTVRTVV